MHPAVGELGEIGRGGRQAHDQRQAHGAEIGK